MNNKNLLLIIRARRHTRYIIDSAFYVTVLRQNMNNEQCISYSDNKTTVSMYREIMEDVPTKYKLPRQVKTCLKTLEKFVQKMKDLALEW